MASAAKKMGGLVGGTAVRRMKREATVGVQKASGGGRQRTMVVAKWGETSATKEVRGAMAATTERARERWRQQKGGCTADVARDRDEQEGASNR